MNKSEKHQLLYKAAKALIDNVKLNDDLDRFIANGCMLTESPYKLSTNSKGKVRVEFNGSICPKCSSSSYSLN